MATIKGRSTYLLRREDIERTIRALLEDRFGILEDGDLVSLRSDVDPGRLVASGDYEVTFEDTYKPIE